ncbi:modulator of DNA gyrase TldD [Xanthomonas citri pv. aurantifolii str. ICPB 11122]|nr:modulator of DNA gyrase TldD [Xanthomonas citri pv. aurantifolii str. ICPB 11122]
MHPSQEARARCSSLWKTCLLAEHLRPLVLLNVPVIVHHGEPAPNPPYSELWQVLWLSLPVCRLQTEGFGCEELHHPLENLYDIPAPVVVMLVVLVPGWPRML